MKAQRMYKWMMALTFGITLTLGACLPDPLEVNGLPVVKPVIVVSTQIIPDQSLVVLLTKSFGALEASDDSDPEDVLNQIAVNDAVVTIAHENQVDTLRFLGLGFYGGVDIDLVPNGTYRLHVVSESLGEVSSTTEVKPQILFENIQTDLYFDGFDDTLAQVTYHISDPSEKNWYMINALEVEREELVDNVLNPRDFTRLVDDAPFNGREFEETFRVFPREFGIGDTIAVYISNISKDYYDFMKLRLDNRFSLVEFVSEPINYPSNIQGGKGYFNLYIPDIRLFVLE